jgi:hypothetical protein
MHSVRVPPFLRSGSSSIRNCVTGVNDLPCLFEWNDSPLLRVTSQRDVRLADVPSRYRGMLGPVEDVDVAHHRLGRDQVGVLRHVTSPVDLSRVIDRLDNLDPRLRRSVRSNLCRPYCISGCKEGRDVRNSPPRSSSYFSSESSD